MQLHQTKRCGHRASLRHTAFWTTICCAGQQVHALDLGCGCGSFALMAAHAGADSVVGVEAHPALVVAARRNVALNGLSKKVGRHARVRACM